MSVKANVITMLKRKLSLGKTDEVLRVTDNWIGRAETAEKKVAELEKENMGQSDLIERLLKECHELRRQFKSGASINVKITDLPEFNSTIQKAKDSIDEVKAENAALRGALEGIKQLFPSIFECCSVEDCLDTDCTMANEAKLMCRQIAQSINQALTASGENRYARIEEAAKDDKKNCDDRCLYGQKCNHDSTCKVLAEVWKEEQSGRTATD